MGEESEILAWRVRKLSRVLTDGMGIDESRDLDSIYNINVFDTLESGLAERPDIVFVTNPTTSRGTELC